MIRMFSEIIVDWRDGWNFNTKLVSLLRYFSKNPLFCHLGVKCSTTRVIFHIIVWIDKKKRNEYFNISLLCKFVINQFLISHVHIHTNSKKTRKLFCFYWNTVFGYGNIVVWCKEIRHTTSCIDRYVKMKSQMIKCICIETMNDTYFMFIKGKNWIW